MTDTIIKKFNGSTFDEVYPKTTVTQIVASGTPGSTTYLRGDGSWQTISSGSSYTFGSGTTNGAFSVTPSGGSAQSVPIYGLGSAAYTASTAYAASSHLHYPTQITNTTYSVPGSMTLLRQPVFDFARANRLAFINPNRVTVEYTDDGTTWSPYPLSDIAKTNIFSGIDTTLYIGATTSAAAGYNVNSKTRITIDAWSDEVGTNERYFGNWLTTLIWVSTNGSVGLNVGIETATIGAPTTFTSLTTGQSLAGWSGPNEVGHPSITYGGSTGQTSQTRKVRFTFGITGVGSWPTYGRATILQIKGYSLSVWTAPNILMKNDHIYSWDGYQNVTFPAAVSANGGSTITRNIADASATLLVNNAHASSTGNIAEFRWQNSTKSSIDKDGNVNISAGSRYKINGVNLSAADVGAATSSHTHGNISNTGAIGTTSGLPIITTTSGVLTTGSFGTTSGTFTQGNDTRFPLVSKLISNVGVLNTSYIDSGLTLTLEPASYYQITLTGSWGRIPDTTGSALKVSIVMHDNGNTNALTGGPTHYGSFSFGSLDSSSTPTIKVIQGTASYTAGGAYTTMQTATATTNVLASPLHGSFTVYTGTSTTKIFKIRVAATNTAEIGGIGINGPTSMTAIKVG